MTEVVARVEDYCEIVHLRAVERRLRDPDDEVIGAIRCDRGMLTGVVGHDQRHGRNRIGEGTQVPFDLGKAW